MSASSFSPAPRHDFRNLGLTEVNLISECRCNCKSCSDLGVAFQKDYLYKNIIELLDADMLKSTCLLLDQIW